MFWGILVLPAQLLELVPLFFITCTMPITIFKVVELIAIVGASESPVTPEIVEGYRVMGALADDEKDSLKNRMLQN